MEEKTVKEVEELNKAYFKSLANTRASASMMVISFTGAFASALFLLFQYFYFVKGYGINPLENYFFDFVLIYVIYLVVATFIPLGMTFIYRRQILSTILLLLSYIGIFLSLILISYIILVYSGTNLQEYNERSLYTIPFLLICTVVGFVYHYFWLKRELKKGFSTNRTMGNYFAKSSAHNNNSLLIIFTVSMLGGVLSGKFALVLGILTAVLFSYGFSQLITEVAYLLYLKTQSKEYWEDVPKKKETFRNLFKDFSLKKAKIRIFLEILFCSIFLGIMYNIGYFSPSSYTPPLAYLVWENIYNLNRTGYFGELYSIYDEKIKNWIQKRKEKMNFKKRELSLTNLIGFRLELTPSATFFDRLISDSKEFKIQMIQNGFYADGPMFYAYNPKKAEQDVLVFTTVGNKLEIKGENTSGIFFQESLNFTTDFYYRHYNQEEPIPYEEIEKEISKLGFKLVNIIHVVLDLYGDYVIDMYCEVEKD